jgi:hypothetical protein
VRGETGSSAFACGPILGLAAPAALGVILLAGCSACGRGAPAGAALPDGARVPDAAAAAAGAAVATDPVLEALWTRAKGGNADDLARLADREGEGGLAERGRSDPSARLVATRAMAFAPEPGALAGLPFLAEIAAGTDEAEAEAALESAIDLAARPRRAIDPEDAAEMKEGCDAMLVLADDVKRPRARRVGAIRALRMLADRGCVDAGAIAADLDAR